LCEAICPAQAITIEAEPREDGSAAIRIACAGQIASHNLHAMQRSSPLDNGAAHAPRESGATAAPSRTGN